MQKIKKSKRNFIVTLAVLALVGFFVISLIRLQIDIRQNEEELSSITESISEQMAANDSVERALDEENEEEYMERIAREKLGYVMPDERVYVDAASGSD